jgi:hypothetical protein
VSLKEHYESWNFTTHPSNLVHNAHKIIHNSSFEVSEADETKWRERAREWDKQKQIITKTTAFKRSFSHMVLIYFFFCSLVGKKIVFSWPSECEALKISLFRKNGRSRGFFTAHANVIDFTLKVNARAF